MYRKPLKFGKPHEAATVLCLIGQVVYLLEGVEEELLPIEKMLGVDPTGRMTDHNEHLYFLQRGYTLKIISPHSKDEGQTESLEPYRSQLHIEQRIPDSRDLQSMLDDGYVLDITEERLGGARSSAGIISPHHEGSGIWYYCPDWSGEEIAEYSSADVLLPIIDLTRGVTGIRL